MQKYPSQRARGLQPPHVLVAGNDGGQRAASLAAESLLPGSHMVEKMVALVAEGRVRQLVRVLGCGDVDVGDRKSVV